MKVLRNITNGVLLIIISLLHTKLALSDEAFGKQFRQFANSNFFRIHRGIDDLPFTPGKTDLVSFSAFWFFYFGIMIIPLGLIVHYVEKSGKALPLYFTISYLAIVAIGSYMMPASGMTYIMLPHAIYMLIFNYTRAKKLKTVKLL